MGASLRETGYKVVAIMFFGERAAAAGPGTFCASVTSRIPSSDVAVAYPEPSVTTLPQSCHRSCRSTVSSTVRARTSPSPRAL